MQNAYIIQGQQGQQRSSLKYGFDDAQRTADYLLERVAQRPRIGIICGSGLQGLADEVQDPQVFSYKDIPLFPVSTAPGHAGRLVFGKLQDKPCVVMQGRLHMYEGYPMQKIVFPVRVMKCLGVEILIVTNASGGLNPNFMVGDLMIIKDHINLPGLCGNNPLIGPNDERFGPRFPAMSEAYDQKLRRMALDVSDQLGTQVREGTYVMQSGPCYESVTECRLLSLLGADVTGMSTVPEVIVARHCGIRVFGMSLVTNMCVTEFDSEDKANEEEVLETGRLTSEKTQKFVAKFIEQIDL